MVIEVALLLVFSGQQAAFESAWREASKMLVSREGYVGHLLGRQCEDEQRYVLQVTWTSLDAHTNFMAHADFQSFIALIGRYFDEPPKLMHFEPIVDLSQLA